MQAITLIAKSLSETEKEPLPCDPCDNVCAVTGEQCSCIPRKHLFGKSFTNADLLKAPGSKYVGVDTYYALKYKWERMSSWLCDGQSFIRLDRQGVRKYVIGGEYPPVWAAYATTSYKKHGALWAPVNTGNKSVWRFEMLTVDCSDRTMLLHIWDRLNYELRRGVSRSVLETLTPNSYAIKAIGIKAWDDLEQWAKPIYQSPLYAFMCYLLPSQEELKHEQDTTSML